MTEIELYNELQNVEGCLKMADSQISELRKKKNDIMNDFLSLLPFQEGDKVKDKNGNIFIIERLKDAFTLGKNEIKVHFLMRKIKKNGEPYQYANEAWGIDYFSLEISSRVITIRKDIKRSNMSEKVITSYKAFDKNMKCRDFQYEVGKEYEMDGEIKCCNRGFNACKSPMEVWDYYDMLNSRYAEVEQSGKIEKEGNSTKICSSRIKIKAELKLADIINIGVEWLKNITSPSKVKVDGVLNDNGDRRKQIGSSGDYAQIGSSGYSAQIDSTGEDSVIMCAGNKSKAKAKVGSWITLAEWKRNDEKNRNIPVCVKTEYVDGENIKADTWYRLQNGKFVEVEK